MYDLALSPGCNVSESLGFELVLGILRAQCSEPSAQSKAHRVQSRETSAESTALRAQR